ncbi:MAG: YezD family protein [Geobacter sp.]|nr:YezD family protein [Geobacter sp.]
MGAERIPVSTELKREVENEILKAIQGIRFGSVEIIIQDSRVIQIERKEKVRFDRVAGNNGRL